MIFGESFERPPNTTVAGQSSYAWQPAISPSLSSRATSTEDTAHPFSGRASQKITIAAGAGTGSAGLANRGLGNEGLYFQQGKEYEGYFFASSPQSVTLQARIETTDGEILATQTIKHTPPSANATSYVQYNFSLIPSKGTECVGIAPNSDPSVHCTNNPGTAHVCINCGGQFTVSLVADTSAAEVNIDYVVLQPGEWGRFKGLNARRDVADTLSVMGIKAIRLGGSFCSVTKDDGEYYQWQKWTGPVWERESIGAHWDSYGGNSYNLIGGWGPFEMIDYAVALGAEPVITTTMSSSPDSFADLVEYCWANESTPMGRQRAIDGHPDQYKLRYIELGNEQYNNNYVEQVAAMEARANAVGAAGELHYIFPSNAGLTGDDVAKAAALKLGDRLVTDLHVGAGGALPVAEDLFAAHSAAGLTDDAAVNFETNAATHNFGRALAEAQDLNDFFNAGNQRMLARTASFCHGRAGHFDMFDQAISFFLPNMTWLQPPGHVHAMITASWQPHALNSTIATPVTPPLWTTLVNKGLTCSGSEYKGDMGATTQDGCLQKAKSKPGVNYAVWQGQGNKNCYVCSITGRGDPASWKLNTINGSVSFEGRNVLAPISVSSQLSDDKQTVVTRLVNQGPAQEVTLDLNGFSPKSASAVTMSSTDPNAENTAADVDFVSPQTLKPLTIKGSEVTLKVPSFSYTTVTANANSFE